MARLAGRDHAIARARSVFFSAALAAVFICLTAAATVAVLSHGSIDDLLSLLLPTLVYFAFGLVLTRNFILAAVAALAPLAGAIWSLGLEPGREALRADLHLGLAFGNVVSLTFVDELAARFGDEGRVGSSGALAALRVVWRPAAGSLLPIAGALVLASDRHTHGAVALSLSSRLLLPPFAAILLVPSGSALARVDEAAVSLINRAREWRAQAAYSLTFVTRPRWGLSVSGIGVTVLVLSYFGAEPLITTGSWMPLAVIPAALPVSLGLTRNWRTAIGISFSIAISLLVGLWAGALQHRGAHINMPGLHEALAVSFALAVTVVQSAPVADNPFAVLAHAIEERAALILCATVSVLASLFVAGQLDIVIATTVFTGAACSLLLAPAVVSALEAVFPRKQSVAALYARRF
jgi:hypothetical protein